MFWEQIKKILPKLKGPCVIVEEGKAKYVILNFDEYESLLSRNQLVFPAIKPSEDPLQIEKINQEINNIKEERSSVDLGELTINVPTEIQIEDLPIE